MSTDFKCVLWCPCCWIISLQQAETYDCLWRVSWDDTVTLGELFFKHGRVYAEFIQVAINRRTLQTRAQPAKFSAHS